MQCRWTIEWCWNEARCVLIGEVFFFEKNGMEWSSTSIHWFIGVNVFGVQLVQFVQLVQLVQRSFFARIHRLHFNGADRAGGVGWMEGGRKSSPEVHFVDLGQQRKSKTWKGLSLLYIPRTCFARSARVSNAIWRTCNARIAHRKPHWKPPTIFHDKHPNRHILGIILMC